jgi:hypothetical protein
MAGLSYLRFAAGVCVLTAGLLIGGVGGAVAVADPDASESTAHGDNGTNGSGKQSSTGAKEPKKPKNEPDGTDTKNGPHGSGEHSGQQPSRGAKMPKHEPDGTDSTDETNDSGLVAVVPKVGAPVPPDVIAPDPNVVTPDPNVVVPVTAVVAPAPNVVAPVTNVAAMIPTLAAPMSDVIASVQDMLTSLAAAVVPLAQLPSDLSSFLLSIAGMQPVVGGIDGGGLSVPASVSFASQSPLPVPFAGIPGALLVGDAPGITTLDGGAASTFGATTQLGGASSLPATARLASNGAFSMGVQSLLRHPYGELLLPVSLWALTAVALPGAGGLVVLTAAGVRVGYRQAKAGFVVQAAGIACFARPGPLGVVHSGSLIVVRPRALRVVRPRALSAECLLDKVA